MAVVAVVAAMRDSGRMGESGGGVGDDRQHQVPTDIFTVQEMIGFLVCRAVVVSNIYWLALPFVQHIRVRTINISSTTI